MTEQRLDLIDDETLRDWVDGFLEPEVAIEVEKRVSEDPELQDRVAELSRQDNLIHSSLEWTAQERAATREGAVPLADSRNKVGPPAYTLLALAACLALVALPVWMTGGFQKETEQPVVPVAMVQPAGNLPTLELESVEAAPGETVYVTLRAKNLKGFCGLQARVRVDNGLEAKSTRSSGFTYAGVREGEVFVASISEDAWISEGGVILRLPVKIQENIGEKRELALEFENIHLIDGDRKSLEVEKRSARIRVL